MNPLKYKLANEWMRQEDASPQEALETWDAMEAEFKANRAMSQEPRTMAQGGGMMGQLVAPSVDGSRPGYSGDYTAAEKKKQGRTLVNRDGKLTLDMHTPEIKKWYNKNYPDKSWWDQKYKSDILDRYYNELGREKPPKGYITTKEYAKKYGFKIYPAKEAKAEGNIISNLLRRQGDERAITRGYDEKTKSFFSKELEPKSFKTTYELAPGKKSSRELLYVKDKGKIHANNLLKYWDSTQLRDHTMKNIDNLLKNETMSNLFQSGDYKGIKKALEGTKGLTNAERANVMLRIAQGMSGHGFRDYIPNIELNKVSANKIFKGFEKEPWNTPFSGAYRDLKRHVIAKNIGGEYFTKSYQGFIDDAREAIKKALNMDDKAWKKFGATVDINELTGLTSGYRNKTFNSTQFINLMDKNFNRIQHATMIGEYGRYETKIAEALKNNNRYQANKLIKEWDAWRGDWYNRLDKKFKTKAIRDILPTFKIGADPHGKIFSKERLATLMDLGFDPRGDYIAKQKLQLAKTFKTQAKSPLLKEVAMGDKKALGQILKTYQNAGVGKDCPVKKAEGGRISFGTGGYDQCMRNAVDEHNKNLKSDNPVVRNKARSTQFNINKTKNMKSILELGGKGINRALRFGKTWGAEWEPIIEGAFYEHARRKGYTHDQAKEETFFWKMADPTTQTGLMEGADPLLEKELYEIRGENEFIDVDNRPPMQDPEFGQVIGERGTVKRYIDNEKALMEARQKYNQLYSDYNIAKMGGPRRSASPEKAEAYAKAMEKTWEEINSLEEKLDLDRDSYQAAVEKQQHTQGMRAFEYGEYGSGDTEKLVKQRERIRQREMEDKFPSYSKAQIDKILKTSGYVVDPNIAKYKKDLEFLTKEDIPTKYQPAFPPGLKAKPVSTSDMIRGILSGEDKLRYYADNFRMEKAQGGIMNLKKKW